MKVGTKEFYEVVEMFEGIVQSSDTCFFLRLTRTDRSQRHLSFYDNGDTDKAFRMFMHGYEAAKCLQRLSE